MREEQPAFWKARDDGSVECGLCPHRCVIAPGRTGLCRVRRNEEGALALPLFGAISGLAVDPIEKKPLHHFLPGSAVFSAGFLGCNLHCPFCQNWEISQSVDVPVRKMSPESLVEAAIDSGCPSIAYTYSEPLVHIEFVLAAMRLARAQGLRNVLVTNGCVGEEPARAVLALTDAANVDLKCWSPDGYRNELGGDLAAVLDFIRAARTACHLEVTTLVVPGFSDSLEAVDSIAQFLAEISPDIPFHLSAYRPAWKHRAPPTSASSLLLLARAARKRLQYVYVGNLASEWSDTRCPSCGSLLVRRRGYDTEFVGLATGGNGPARCMSCSANIPILL